MVGRRAVRGLGWAAGRRGDPHRGPDRGPPPARRERTAHRSSRSPEPRADRSPGAHAPSPHGRSWTRRAGAARRGRGSEGVLMADDRVGRVLGSEHTTTGEFRVVLEEDEYLQLDDLVVVRTQVPKVGRCQHLRRGDRGGGRVRGRAVGVGHPPDRGARHHARRQGAHGTRRGHPCRPGDLGVGRPRRRGRASHRRGAEEGAVRRRDGTSARRSDSGRDGLPVHVDLDFFDGRKGGHMSISGISGVATKTSFALFFLRMLTASPQVVGEGAANLRVLVFNVKGEDLLWLDMPNRDFPAHDGAREAWTALGVDPAPFPSVRFWAPPRRQSGDVVVPDTGGRLDGRSRSSPGHRASSSTRTCSSSASRMRTTPRTRSRSSANVSSSSCGASP